MTAYTLTPVDHRGVDFRRSEVVHGPLLEDSLTRAELSRRLVAQAQELELLKKQLPVAQAAARHMEQLRGRMNIECGLRTRYQQRLHRVALALAVIEGMHPEAREAVAAARESIFGIEEESDV